MYLVLYSVHFLVLTVMATAIKNRHFSGDGTYYDVGLGSCGISNSNNQLVAALNAPQMNNGANPNLNKLCNKAIRVTGPRGSVTVRVVDTCPSCAYGSVDLSPYAFQHIADLKVGRVPITWDWV